MADTVKLNGASIEDIRKSTGQVWQPVQRADYKVFARVIKPGYVFANYLDQPEEYKVIVEHNNGAPIMKLEDAEQVPEIAEIISNGQCVSTREGRVVLIGTIGEMWDVNTSKLAESYTYPDGSEIDIENLPQDDWFEVYRRHEDFPSAVAIQLPAEMLGEYQTSWSKLFPNNPESPGHGSGDILVVPLDFKHVSPTHNVAFYNTYSKDVGDFHSSGKVAKSDDIPDLSLDIVRDKYKV